MDKDTKSKKIARIVALTGAIILLLMFVATLIVALVDFPNNDKVLAALLGCDIIIPTLIWIYLIIYRTAAGRDKALKTTLDKITDADNKENSEL